MLFGIQKCNLNIIINLKHMLFKKSTKYYNLIINNNIVFTYKLSIPIHLTLYFLIILITTSTTYMLNNLKF